MSKVAIFAYTISLPSLTVMAVVLGASFFLFLQIENGSPLLSVPCLDGKYLSFFFFFKLPFESPTL